MSDNPVPKAYSIIDRQTNWGILLVLLPSTIIIIGLPLAAMGLFASEYSLLALGLGVICSVPLGWGYWSLTVGHWFLHALARTPQEYWLELQQTAVAKQLLWPAESRWNKTILVLPRYADLWDYSQMSLVSQQRTHIQRTLLDTLPEITFLKVSRIKVVIETGIRLVIMLIMAIAAMSNDMWIAAVVVLVILYPYSTGARRRLRQTFRKAGDGLYISGWGIYSDDARAIYLPWYKVQQLEYDDSQQQIKVIFGAGGHSQTKTIFCGDYQQVNYRWFKNVLVAYWHHRSVPPPVSI